MSRKPYPNKQSRHWWLRNPAYRRYMLREATAIPLLVYCLLLVYGLYCLGRGGSAFIAWLELLRSPPAIGLQLLALSAALLHAWTWIELVPKIVVLDTPPFKISGVVIKRAHQLLAVAVFVVLIGLLLRSLDAGSSGAETAVVPLATSLQSGGR